MASNLVAAAQGPPHADPLQWGRGVAIFKKMAAGAAVMLVASSPVDATPLTDALAKLAAAGNAEALYHLGMAWQVGVGVAQDHVRALDAFRRAAALGDPLAAYKLGCYYDGQDEGLVAPDPREALRFKLIAARAGYALAQHDVGIHYLRRGDGAAALPWLALAAAQGPADALNTYAAAYNVGPGIARDPAKTAAYFRLAMARSEPSAKQRDWLAAFVATLSPAQRVEADRIVRSYRPAPTALTLKALSGQRAAEELVRKK